MSGTRGRWKEKNRYDDFQARILLGKEKKCSVIGACEKRGSTAGVEAVEVSTCPSKTNAVTAGRRKKG